MLCDWLAGYYTHSSGFWVYTNNYTESSISYDLNGNLKTYTRCGLTSGTSTFGVIDNLSYTYSSTTKGFKYTGSLTGDHYLYDANGNLTQDKHTCPVPKVGKDLSFNYNHLNLPNSIKNSADSYITLTYTADGEKLTKVAGGVTRNYVAGSRYTNATGRHAIRLNRDE